MKRILILSLIAILSFAVGWITKPSNNYISAKVAEPNIGKPSKPGEQNNQTQLTPATAMARDHNSEESQTKNSIATKGPALQTLLDSLAQRIADGETDQQLDSDLRRAIIGLTHRDDDPPPYHRDNPELRELFETHPRLVEKMLDHIMSIDDQKLKTDFSDGFLSGIASSSAFKIAEQYMLNKVQQGEPLTKWFDWTNHDIGPTVTLPSSANFFASQLGSLTDPLEIAIALNGINGPIGNRFSSLQLGPKHKDRLSSLVGPYLNSTDPKVRAAAAKSINQFPTSEQITVLPRMLNDASENVRAVAIRKVTKLVGNDPLVITSLIGLARDKSFPLHHRYSAISAAQSANQLKQFEQEIYDLYKGINEEYGT